MYALLAPVPEDHLGDALRVCAAEGRVAFGSGWVGEEKSGSSSWELFESLKREGVVPGLPVLIYASSTSDTGLLRYHRPGYVTFVGQLVGATSANSAGKHPRAEVRPASALSGDTPAAVFWEVAALRLLNVAEQFPYAKLKRVSRDRSTGIAITSYPRGPTRVLVPKELEAVVGSPP